MSVAEDKKYVQQLLLALPYVAKMILNAIGEVATFGGNTPKWPQVNATLKAMLHLSCLLASDRESGIHYCALLQATNKRSMV